MGFIRVFNYVISICFAVCYLYQFIYILIPFLLEKYREKKEVIKSPVKENNYAVLICARNEEKVIGNLITSINNQTYPQDKITIFVMADNCSDRTLYVAKKYGAVVYERFNQKLIGKGYALEELLSHIRRDFPEGFDGFYVFDADNVLKNNYFEEMDKTFCQGNDIVTGYRNSKNYGDNWISAGYALWFLRESRYLNESRYLIGSSCAVSGTGFMFGRKVFDELIAWPYHLLVEDIEFSVDQILKGRKIAFCKKAELYDEQPVTLSQSWKQRLRWSKGYLQVFRHYGLRLVKGILRGSFSCYDITMNIMPAFILSSVSIAINFISGVMGFINGQDISVLLLSFGEMFLNAYLTLFVIGAVTTITEWKKIRTSVGKKILYSLTFPLFMFTYFPISIHALFWKGKWEPIYHNVKWDFTSDEEKPQIASGE